MGSDRRTFFRDLVRGAARATNDFASAVRDELPDAGGGRHRAAALPAARLASLEELRRLAAEVGLGERADEIAAHARTGIRLTPGGVGSSRLGGAAELPPWLPWPAREGEELTFVGQLRLPDLPPSELPAYGLLLVFHGFGTGACEVVHVDEGPAGAVDRTDALPELPLVPSLELTLPPSPPGAQAEPFALDAWTLLRERLAEAQGVELAPGAGAEHAVHRLLGHPDAVAGPLPELEDDPAWRLLLQLGAGDVLPLPGGTRLYVRIRDEDLRAGRFDGVRAVVR